ncbi:hypothetical protein [Kitasatospora sp. CB02891]|uniref:hypothetical protein n=1 Tax=Kitasatospora sp. CB02891 TaxID=2020329 RepID=UPI000C27DFA3|nr:hypothetical protein [Kitasatospora sp. CB02891]PJN25033.1 hypothetical protein CG736_16280 [Kitasatospora sp. CB02891]
MNHRNRAQLFLAVVVGGLLPIYAGWKLGWPIWLWFLVSAASMALVGLVLMARVTQPAVSEPPVQYSVEPPLSRPEPPTELPFNETRLDDLALPSCLPDYDLRFSATVRWRPSRPHQAYVHANLAAAAVDTVVARARQLAAGEHPGRTDLAAYRLNGALGTPVNDSSGLVTVMAVAVMVTVTEEDRVRLENLASLRKTEDAWEQQRQHERNRCAYVGGEVLKSPGSAVVWWLSRHEDQIEQAVSLIGPLAELSAAANDAEVPEVFRPYLGRRPGEAEDPVDVEYADLLRQEQEAATRVDTEDSAAQRIMELMDELGVSPDSDRGKVWLHRLGRATQEAMRDDPEDVRPGPDRSEVDLDGGLGSEWDDAAPPRGNEGPTGD